MSQPDASKLHGNWKALFLCPNPKICRELASLISPLLGSFTPQELNAYPNRHQLAEVLAAESPNLCILEVSDPVERGIASIADVVRADPKLPIVVVLSNDSPELVLRCLRQGASDFLTQPFTAEQVKEHVVPLLEDRK